MKVWEKVKDFLMPEETIELDDLEDTMVAAEEPKAVVNGPVYSAPQSQLFQRLQSQCLRCILIRCLS